MDRDQEHEKQEGSKPTADAKLQDTPTSKDKDPSELTQLQEDPKQRQNIGEDSGDFNTVTLNDESLDETQYQGEKKLIEGTPDAASKNDREGMCDGVNPVTTKETANTSGESQSGGGALLKKDKNTVDTASKEEKESVSGIESVTGHSSTQSEKSTNETQNKRGSLPNDSNSLKTGEPAEDTTSNIERNNQSSDSDLLKNDKSAVDPASTDERKSQCDDVKPTSTDERNPSGESQSSDDEVLKNGESTADTTSTNGRENNSGDSEKQTSETVSTGIKMPDDDSFKTLKSDSPKDPSQESEISPSDVGNSAISKHNLPKASPDAANYFYCKPDRHSDNDKAVVSDNQKRLMNDDRKEDKDLCTPNTQSTVSTKCSKEDKPQEETVEDQLRQSLEKNEQRCKDIQKEYEKVKKDYESMERKFESISKEKEELLVKNNKITKELDETIKAFTKLVEKDIENQKEILELKTNLPDIQKRYDDMTKQKSRVENQLKEQQKSWAQEKHRLQKDHNDESKKLKKEIEKANKEIGSLNQKVADKDEELKKKRHLIDDLIREKKKVDKENADHESYIQNLHEHIKKTNEQKIKDEREHKKKVKDLNLMIQTESDNLNRLSYQYNELVQKIQSLQEENRSLTREKQELLLRLSKVAGANLTYNNPNIADLSDEKRPTKLAEEFSELYDNEWTDAFEDLQIENEKEKTTFMLELVMKASQLCSDVSSDHGQKIKDSLCTLVFPSKLSKCSKECTDEDIIPAAVAPLEETNSSTQKVVIIDDKKIEDSKLKAGNLPSTSENTFGSGKTKENVQETTENTENKKGKTADDTKQSPSIQDRENKDNKDEETADDANQSTSKKEQETTENTEETTADDTKQLPSDSEQDTTENTENNEGETAEITDTRRPPSVNEGGSKRDKEEKTADDANNPQSSDKEKDISQTENDVAHRSVLSQEQAVVNTNGEEDDSSYSNQQDDAATHNANDDTLEAKKQENAATHGANENTPEAKSDKEKDISQTENDVAHRSVFSQEQAVVNTNGEEDDSSYSNIQEDAVTNTANDNESPEAKKQENAATHGANDDTLEAKKQENAATHGAHENTPEAKKQEDAVTNSANDNDTPEAKEPEASVVKEVGKEEAEKEIKLVSNFEELLQKEQKKIIMDAKKLVEKHLSEKIEKAGTDLIVQEHRIDTQKQESIVDYIKKCMNICWSMHRNEPPVFVEFPDITENIEFDTNKFKPYTKSGKYIDYIVWPAVYLHKGGPLLCKGVAQGRKE